MEKGILVNASSSNPEQAWKIFNLVVAIATGIMKIIFGPEPEK